MLMHDSEMIPLAVCMMNTMKTYENKYGKIWYSTIRSVPFPLTCASAIWSRLLRLDDCARTARALHGRTGKGDDDGDKGQRPSFLHAAADKDQNDELRNDDENIGQKRNDFVLPSALKTRVDP